MRAITRLLPALPRAICLIKGGNMVYISGKITGTSDYCFRSMKYIHPNEAGKLCAAAIKNGVNAKTGKPLSERELGFCEGVLYGNMINAEAWKRKQQYKPSPAGAQNKKPFMTREYSKSELASMFADNDIFSQTEIDEDDL